eukprot:2578905-Pyramimonas_sp.AAC.1
MAHLAKHRKEGMSEKTRGTEKDGARQKLAGGGLRAGAQTAEPAWRVGRADPNRQVGRAQEARSSGRVTMKEDSSDTAIPS